LEGIRARRSFAETSIANASLILSMWTISKPSLTSTSQTSPGLAWQRGQARVIGANGDVLREFVHGSGSIHSLELISTVDDELLGGFFIAFHTTEAGAFVENNHGCTLGHRGNRLHRFNYVTVSSNVGLPEMTTRKQGCLGVVISSGNFAVTKVRYSESRAPSRNGHLGSNNLEYARRTRGRAGIRARERFTPPLDFLTR
jgi:hypothetical protein